MMHVFRRAWSDVFIPILHRPRHQQVAALCYQDTPTGREVLLITSRDTGRWVIPKGWPMKGKTQAEAALQEAWEEAGVRDAKIDSAPVGFFDYLKVRKKVPSVPVKAHVYMVEVKTLSPEYPEVNERKRAWFSPGKAAELVDEADLKALITAL